MMYERCISRSVFRKTSFTVLKALRSCARSRISPGLSRIPSEINCRYYKCFGLESEICILQFSKVSLTCLFIRAREQPRSWRSEIPRCNVRARLQDAEDEEEKEEEEEEERNKKKRNKTESSTTEVGWLGERARRGRKKPADW